MLAEAGLTLLGENRAQDLVAKARGVSGPLHLGLHRPSAEPQGPAGTAATSATSRRSPATRRSTQLRRHGDACTEVLVEVNVAGEAGKSGIAPAELPGFLERCPVRVVGLMTMPPLAAGARGQPPALRGAARAGPRAPAAPTVDGDQPGLHRGGRGGSDDRAPRYEPLPLRSVIITAGNHRSKRKPQSEMALRDTWHRTLMYFGLADDEDYEDDLEPYQRAGGRGPARLQRPLPERSPPELAPPARRVRRHLRRRPRGRAAHHLAAARGRAGAATGAAEPIGSTSSRQRTSTTSRTSPTSSRTRSRSS